jgi:uncharacterized membrane-anchored protein
MSKHLDHILAQGVITGLLAPIGDDPAYSARPWPLTVLTGIGAWFAAIPFVVILFLISGGQGSLSLAILGAVVLGIAIAVLRMRPVPFLEQFAFAAMVAGILALFANIAFSSNIVTAARIIFFVFALVAALVPQTWLCVLLGVGMGSTAILSLYGIASFETVTNEVKLWSVLWVSAAWCLLSAMSSRQFVSTQLRACMEAVSLGVSVAIICAPFWTNDVSFFVLLDSFSGRGGVDFPGAVLAQGVAVAVTLGSAVYMVSQWAPLRAPWFVVVAFVLAAFTWCMPSLCVLALVGAVSVISGRRSTAVLCAAMLIWWIGRFYFSLQFPLVEKAVLLATSGAVLALTAALLMQTHPVEHAAPAALARPRRSGVIKPQPMHAVALLGSAVLALVIVNISIVKKENLARTGQTLFIQLAPVDPRSLIQGDYMRLNFATGARPEMESSDTPTALVGVLNEDGVWTARRNDDGTPLASGEIKINLSGTPAHPILVTDAWFFKEGEAKRWETARFGEFRVKPDGSAVLVTLRGPRLELL